MLNCSFFPLCLFLSRCLFFHISPSHSSSPSCSHLIHLLFVALLLSLPSSLLPLDLFFIPPPSPSSPPSFTQFLCNPDHQAPASQHIAHVRICIMFLSRLHIQSYHLFIFFRIILVVEVVVGGGLSRQCVCLCKPELMLKVMCIILPSTAVERTAKCHRSVRSH